MLDLAYLIALTDELEKRVTDRDIDKIVRFCEEQDGFIRSIKPSKEEEASQIIKRFAYVHQQAIELVQDVHLVMQDQLFKSTKTRKGVTQYKGVKHAE